MDSFWNGDLYSVLTDYLECFGSKILILFYETFSVLIMWILLFHLDNNRSEGPTGFRQHYLKVLWHLVATMFVKKLRINQWTSTAVIIMQRIEAVWFLTQCTIDESILLALYYMDVWYYFLYLSLNPPLTHFIALILKENGNGKSRDKCHVLVAFCCLILESLLKGGVFRRD